MSTSSTVRAWSTTDATNASTDSNISSSDSQSPDTLDNNVRSIMAAVKKQMNDIGGSLAAGGTANALTVTTGQVLESGQLTDGLRVLLWMAALWSILRLAMPVPLLALRRSSTRARIRSECRW